VCFPDGWFAVELGPGFQLRPSAYTLRNGGGTVAAVMVGWVLEGAQSPDGPWHTLDIKGGAGERPPISEHACLAFLQPARQTPWDQWPHHSVRAPPSAPRPRPAPCATAPSDRALRRCARAPPVTAAAARG